jgi:hypothetical protein
MADTWKPNPPESLEIKRQADNNDVFLTRDNPLPGMGFGELPKELEPNAADTDEQAKDRRRRKAEEEAARDLLKPYQQLLADAHEELLPKHKPETAPADTLLHAQKRIMSLMARSAISNDQASEQLCL